MSDERNALAKIQMDCNYSLQSKKPFRLKYVLENSLHTENKANHMVTDYFVVECDNYNAQHLMPDDTERSVDITHWISIMLDLTCKQEYVNGAGLREFMPLAHKDNEKIVDACNDITKNIVSIAKAYGYSDLFDDCEFSVLYRTNGYVE